MDEINRRERQRTQSARCASSAGWLEETDGRVVAKIGAEGVHCAAVPELGIGIAVKVDDGPGFPLRETRYRRSAE